MGGGALSPLALANKAESVVSITSQCSFSSTIVHVGDKKPPESGMGVADGAQNQGSIWSLSQSSLLPCLFLPSGPKWREGASILAFPCLSPTLLPVFLLSIHTQSLGCRVQPKVLPTEGLKATLL